MEGGEFHRSRTAKTGVSQSCRLILRPMSWRISQISCCPECIMLAGMRNDLYWRNGYWPMELWNCGMVECTAWLGEGMTLCA